MEYKNKKCLIAYFSRKGNNYVDGRIVDLVVGNTEIVARLIHDRVAAEMFHIQTVDGYPADYTQTTEMAKVQLQCHARPEVTKTVPNMKDYDIIFLGYPNWWGSMPMAVFTFLESYDFSGKTIIPFCTHEGSGMGHSERDIRTCCPTAQILKGLPLRGSHVQAVGDDIVISIRHWLKQ